MSNSFVGIDLFAGAGGLSLGLTNAGFEMKLGIEIDRYAATTLQYNNPEQKIIAKDIRALKPLAVLKKCGLNQKKIDLIAGGPPCQGFSESNKRSRTTVNPLNDLYLEYFKFVKQINPKVFIFENVAGIKTLQKGCFFNKITEFGEGLGYSVYPLSVNTVDFGIPQKRNRIFFIGTKENIEIPLKFPKKRQITIRAAIDDLPSLPNGNVEDEKEYSKFSHLSKYQKKMKGNSGKTVKNNLVTKNGDLVIKRYQYIPNGGNWTNIPKRLMKNYRDSSNCHSWIYHRLSWDLPSVVISNFRKNMLIHPQEHRGLSVREAARLQSFPDNYIFLGPLGSQQQQVANAVPPLLAEQIGQKLFEYL